MTLEAGRTALLWTNRSGPVLRGLTHRFGNGLHALSLVSGGHDETLGAEDAALLRDELLGFERLTEQYRALVLALEEEPAAGQLEDALAVAIGLRGAHVAVRDGNLVPTVASVPPAVLAPLTALAQALLLLLLGDTPDADRLPQVTVSGDATVASVAVRGAFRIGPDPDAEAAVHYLLRAVRPAATLTWDDTDGVWTATLSLPSLRASRRVAGA